MSTLNSQSNPIDLPAAIWDLILLNARESDLARVARTAYAVLHLVLPYLWRAIDVESLLVLLPGAWSLIPGHTTTLEVSFVDTDHSNIVQISLTYEYRTRYLFRSQMITLIVSAFTGRM